MARSGTFAKEGDPFPGIPYSPFFGVPHHLKTEADIKAWRKKANGIVLILANVIDA
jgi:hypothetical protein